jgi:hypothetical protein
MNSQKMKKLLVNAAMAGMIAGAGVMVPAAGSATSATEVSQNSCGGKSGCGGKDDCSGKADEAKSSERHACKLVQGQGRLRLRGRQACLQRSERLQGSRRLQERRQRLRRQELVQGQGRLRRSRQRKERLKNSNAGPGLIPGPAGSEVPRSALMHYECFDHIHRWRRRCASMRNVAPREGN